MEEIKVGEYCRTKQGYIAKIIDIDLYFNEIEFDNTIISRYEEKSTILEYDNEEERNEIIKHSPNIIDLLHGGDFVNGHKIAKITIDPITKKKRIVTEDWEEDTFAHDIRLIQIYNEEIETVVTEEQFNSIKYVLGGNNG